MQFAPTSTSKGGFGSSMLPASSYPITTSSSNVIAGSALTPNIRNFVAPQRDQAFYAVAPQ